MNDCIFQENILNDNLAIENSKNVTMVNTSCLLNNKKGLILMNGGGTCFVFRYVDNIVFEYVTISDSYNNQTTVGVKLIESQVQILINL